MMMTIPLQFASLYDGQEVFVWSDCLLNLGTGFLVGGRQRERRKRHVVPSGQTGTICTLAVKERRIIKQPNIFRKAFSKSMDFRKNMGGSDQIGAYQIEL